MTTRTQTLKTSIPRVHELCMERARIVTGSYMQTEGEAACLRRAKALKKVLEEMTIFITDGQLLVGDIASKRGATPVFPEFSTFILTDLQEMMSRPGYKVAGIDPDEPKKMLEYWKGNTVDDLVNKKLGPELAAEWLRLEKSGIVRQERRESGIGLVAGGYDKVLNKGLTGIIDDANESIKKIQAQKNDPERSKKIDFLESVIIAAEGAIRFASRYATEARRLAKAESNPQRQRELEKIASVCDQIPENPARNFYEALQAVLFCQLIVQIESNGRSVGMGRFDQYMYPFYQKDISSGNLTRDQAQELLECFFVKLSEVDKMRPLSIAQEQTGNMFQQLTIGGQTVDGKDASNELSYLVIDAQKSIKLIQPNISMRIFEGTPESLIYKAFELVKMGGGMPSFFSDAKNVDYLHRSGRSLDDARNYSIIGCEVPAVPGHEVDFIYTGDLVNLHCFNLALHNGADPVNGAKMGPTNGGAAKFKSIKDVIKAYQIQVDFFSKLLMKVWKPTLKAQSELAPCPFLSSLIDDCIVRGKSTRDGGARYSYEAEAGINGLGIMNVADSLAVMKKFVFEDKVVSPVELVEILKNNYKGKEDLRLMFLRKVAKYGNDDDFVDNIAHDLVHIHINSLGVKPPNNQQMNTLAMNVVRGRKVGATPDGRKDGEPFADGGASPAQGRDIKGPTAVVKSAGKLEQKQMMHSLLNQKLHPALLEGEENQKKIADFIKAYLIDLKGHMIQFNVVTEETLRAAQRESEKYADLLVRVSGFSAYFTQLSKDIQDDIISRTLQTTL